MADDVPERLLRHLRAALGDDALEFAAPPQRLAGGNETLIYAFELADPPEPFAGPLVLRLFREAAPDRARFEQAVQNALADSGYPAPDAPLAEDDAAPLGNPFLVMRRLPGRMLGDTLLELSEQGNARPALSPGRLLAFFGALRTLADAQARLHALDPEPVRRALEDIGRSRHDAGFEGRIASARRCVEEADLVGLRPGLAWLETHAPAPAQRTCVCHGDFNPNNLLVDGDGAVVGVLDWTHTTLADPALDVAYLKVAFETVPISLPPGVRRIGRVMQRLFAARYLALYARRRSLDPGALRYYEVLRCVELLAWRGAHRRAGVVLPDAWNGPDGKSNLIAHVRERIGLSLELPEEG